MPLTRSLDEAPGTKTPISLADDDLARYPSLGKGEGEIPSVGRSFQSAEFLALVPRMVEVRPD